ncbi:MAG: 3-deoxy-7-phosphoheptulonate synthase [Candidatus Brocadiae bacterium]|nr:3-deoxy-7-phosphoheptulonate synthase [Candidatus Brocadiia bacterium]
MIVVMKGTATARETGAVLQSIEGLGFRPHISSGEERTVIGIIGSERKVDPSAFEGLAGVERVIPILKPYKLASREFKQEDTVVEVRGRRIGGRSIVVMAGPCAVESREQVQETAKRVRAAGATVLRGGAYKPRTSPYAFQGMGRPGLEILREAADANDLAVVTEIISVQDIPAMVEFADILQIGARNMQNFNLLEEVGRAGKPVLLKRGMMSTLEELLLSAEYILSTGNYNVILCERGIRTFEKFTRNTYDVSAVPVLKKLSHLPVICDPSHAAGDRDLVPALARAGVAAGADGLIIEVHPNPAVAKCDGAQSLTPDQFDALMKEVGAIARCIGRSV